MTFASAPEAKSSDTVNSDVRRDFVSVCRGESPILFALITKESEHMSIFIECTKQK